VSETQAPQFGRIPSGIITGGALAASGADRTELLILLGIAARADKSFSAYPSMIDLATCAGVTERSARRAVRRLEERGIITAEVHRGRSNAHTYPIKADALNVRLSEPKTGHAERPVIATENRTFGHLKPDVWTPKTGRPGRPPNREQRTDSTASEFSFPLRGRGEFHLTADRLAEYRDTFPGIDIPGELRKARLWLTDNPDRRKTARGMPRFLSGWLNRAKPTGPALTVRGSPR